MKSESVFSIRIIISNNVKWIKILTNTHVIDQLEEQIHIVKQTQLKPPLDNKLKHENDK